MKTFTLLLSAVSLALILTAARPTLAQDKSSKPIITEKPEKPDSPAANKKMRERYMAKKISWGSINPQTELWIIPTKGLVCDFCARSIIAIFNQQDFINGVDVDLKEKIVAVSLKPLEDKVADGKKPMAERLKNLIEDAGYEAGKMTLYPVLEAPLKTPSQK